MNRLRTFWPLLMLLLAACDSTRQDIAADVLYPGLQVPMAISVNKEVALAAADGREVELKIFYPTEGGEHPLVVLSHGTFSNVDRYDLIAVHWAQHGYVVILPQHKDANYGVRPTGFAVMQDIAMSRVADMSLVLDRLDDIEKRVPALAGRIRRAGFVAAGHSIGTQVAMLSTGMEFRTPFDGELQADDESRFSALVLISDPGKMRMMPTDTWLASDVPTFMATGTDDYGLMGSREQSEDPESDVLPSEVVTDRYLLLLEGGDHYFGGLIQKDVEAADDVEGLKIFNALSTAFLDAYASDSVTARQYLEQVDIKAVTRARASLQKTSPVKSGPAQTAAQ